MSVIAFEYDGNERGAVAATCRRADGRQYEVAASEVVIPRNLPGADYLAAYRQWMGLDPYQGVRFVIDDVRAKVSWEKSMANEL